MLDYCCLCSALAPCVLTVIGNSVSYSDVCVVSCCCIFVTLREMLLLPNAALIYVDFDILFLDPHLIRKRLCWCTTPNHERKTQAHW